ncbi:MULTISPECIES: hypothetical protein [unclassified Mesorhizobium]|uniref:hypothetical protein n=1 Tax=unclassified Mesorhizobium TaxID=325217 RepID=UPI00114DE2D5|nr:MULTISPECIES: hypothetical protein [unclassified Mesorhizobium]MBZ9683630.1 hypothetical protein [Mesorhizobium sp. CO1-1-2]MBZ9696510.1 hypothetical protein [Mesorhizobium sp. CO1-1-9]MBZ9725498.1 hypothetical protein [Mesorhizobium sp. CO1-1-11]MBZ9923567.1 hypothetical protein [Mesorhizobium sp. BR1-1-4]TPK80150.1 hypothetical protein FJ936_28840 [Mesorhizobium sp. B2-4-13]
MDKRYKDIQAHYLAEMRTILPGVMTWWKAQAVRDASKLVGSAPQNEFESRWPAGPTAHPRVLHVFRKYFLEIDNLNLHNESREAPGSDDIEETDWGADDEPEVDFQLAIDLLVDDLPSVAPDVYELVKGLVFVPIGQSPDEETC